MKGSTVCSLRVLNGQTTSDTVSSSHNGHHSILSSVRGSISLPVAWQTPHPLRSGQSAQPVGICNPFTIIRLPSPLSWCICVFPPVLCSALALLLDFLLVLFPPIRASVCVADFRPSELAILTSRPARSFILTAMPYRHRRPPLWSEKERSHRLCRSGR